MLQEAQVDVLANGNARVATIKPEDTVAFAAKIMLHKKIGCLLVANQQSRVVGILTERDITVNVVGKSLDPAHTSVADVMTRKVVACTMSTPLPRAQQVMAEHSVRHLPIMENGQPIGMISSRDILAHQLATVQAIARLQSKVINDLEHQHPGISSIVRDGDGRVVI